MTPDWKLRFGLLGGCLRRCPCGDITEEFHLNLIYKKVGSRVRDTKGDYAVSGTQASKLGGALTSPPRPPVPRAPSSVPKILQCESVELCHAWPLPYHVGFIAEWDENGYLCVQQSNVSVDSMVWWWWHVEADRFKYLWWKLTKLCWRFPGLLNCWSAYDFRIWLYFISSEVVWSLWPS